MESTMYFDNSELFGDMVEQLQAAEAENAMLRRACEAYQYGVESITAELKAERERREQAEHQAAVSAAQTAKVAGLLEGFVRRTKGGCSDD